LCAVVFDCNLCLPFHLMSTDSAFLYSYRITLNGKQLGPFDRRTVVGMRAKKLLGNNVVVLRSDGLSMTVAQLMMDRLEQADAQGGVHHPAGAPASGLWPTFAVDFGGSWLRAGALGFVGRGELRFQGDVLRLAGKRKTSWFSSKHERMKLSMHTVASVSASAKDACVLELVGKPEQPFVKKAGQHPVQLRLDDMDAAAELLELMQTAT
jgi:hypothetical protein